MTAGCARPRTLPTPTLTLSQDGVMRSPRSWSLSEVNVAARAILDVEKVAARANRSARWIGQISQSIRTSDVVAQRWSKGRLWLEWVIKVFDVVSAEPDRLGAIVAWMDRGGAPNVGWAWVCENRAGTGPCTPLPPEGARRELVTTSWKPSDVNLAGRALLRVALESELPSARTTNPARRRRKAMSTIAQLWGETADWLQKVFDVCEAAEAEPDLFGKLVGVMDKAGRPQAAWKRIHTLRDEQRVLTLAPTTARFRTLVIDPPWSEDNISASGGHDYALMSFEDIAKLPVQDWAEENCHLWLWITNNIVPLASSLIATWGFEHKTMHTWVKETGDLTRNDPKIGLGRDFRNSTEHVLFARRGTREALPRREATLSIPTHHRWPVGKNSEKPEAFYDLVRACSYPPYGEAFQRLERPDFLNLYQPAPAAVLEAAE
ncbi:MT-A70 family methyltransferase [Methylobacterium sp. WL120]|uniref:MT-A70 family methyltransferase n=1 Tax=Methylobacterium sp. WL120 TaxID=2603887 RepID=UPI001FED4B15|nr:MT-A70 family methyltransferase [Methylobacterium sp. WL120]